MPRKSPTGPRLFAVYLGGRAPRCNTELHDVIFVAGASIEECYPQVLLKWFGDPRRVHIDSWVELNWVDGYRVSLKENPQDSAKKLFFINLGAYRPGEFTELHANAFIVAKSEDEVKKRAKAELLVGMLSVHKDDLYDVDDCLEISGVNGLSVHLAPSTGRVVMEPRSAYHVIPAAAVDSFLRSSKPNRSKE